MQGFGGEHGPRPSSGIILKWVLNRMGSGAWTGLFWLRIRRDR